jgi:hypothetical protein
VRFIFMPAIARINLLVPHNATILPDQEREFAGVNLHAAGPERVARAASELTLCGQVEWQGEAVAFYHVEHGEPVNLPKPRPNTYNVVSKLTILAALRTGRTTDDLLFLYGDRRKGKRFLGVTGLGQIVPQDRPEPARATQLPTGLVATRVINACPYPAKYYSPDTPSYVPENYPPQITLGTASKHRQLNVMYEHELNAALTKRLGIPVYRTYTAGVTNTDTMRDRPNRLRIVNPNVLVALGAEAVAKGYVTLTQEVRSENTGSILGGRALGMFGTSILLGPRA